MMERGGTFVETVVLPNAFMFSLGGFPGINLGGPGSIVCDLYRIDDPGLVSVTDQYESAYGTDPLYFRRIVEINGIKAYIYEYNGTGSRIVESGDWTKHAAA